MAFEAVTIKNWERRATICGATNTLLFTQGLYFLHLSVS